MSSASSHFILHLFGLYCVILAVIGQPSSTLRPESSVHHLLAHITPGPSRVHQFQLRTYQSRGKRDNDNGEVQGVWYSACQLDGQWPCIAYCSVTDSACLESASSIAQICGASWRSYESVEDGLKPPGAGWHNTTTVVSYTNPGGTRTTEVEVFTSFRTATEGIVVGASTFSTMTPIYALGSPVLSTITTIEPLYPQPTYTVLTAPTPRCKYTAYSRIDRSECGKCTITGGTVDLYFWPPAQTGTSDGTPRFPTSTGVVSTVVDGNTLISPTVYISIHTIYASDACLQVGKRHHGTIVAMNPEEISTQVHVGGKAAAYSYRRLDYNDLTGLPPVSNYEMQPSCLVTGCPTIYYTSWNPTLVVPSKVRAIDPAWATCGLDLAGL
jgi:hypothetical protein